MRHWVASERSGGAWQLTCAACVFVNRRRWAGNTFRASGRSAGPCRRAVRSLTPLWPALRLQVVSTNVVVNKPKTATLGPLRIAENLVGDATGVIVLQTRGIQVDQVQPGKVMHLHNAKVEFFKGTMRLTVDTRKDVGTGKVGGGGARLLASEVLVAISISRRIGRPGPARFPDRRCDGDAQGQGERARQHEPPGV